MARILGLDPGAMGIRAVLLETSFKGVTVVSRSELPGGTDGSVTDFSLLAEHLKANGQLHADQVIVAVPGTAVTTQHLSLPFTDARRISATLGFEVESSMPFDMSEMVWDHQVLSSEGGKSEILVGCSRIEHVSSLLDALRSAGLDPRVVTGASLAYQNLLGAAQAQTRGSRKGAQASGEAEAILDIGQRRSAICICGADGGLLTARSFPSGGKGMTDAIANAFHVSEEDAEAWKVTEGDMERREDDGAEMDKARAAMERALAPIVREVRSTIRFCGVRFHVTPTRIHLVGGTACLKGVGGYLTGQLGVETAPLELDQCGMGRLGLMGDDVRYALATSLALQGLGGMRGHRLNFRKGSLAFKGDLDFLKGKVSRLGVFALVLAVLAGVSMAMEWSNVKKREQAVDASLFEMTKKVLGQGQKDYAVALNMLKGSSSVGAQLPQLSAVDIFGSLLEGAQKADVKLEEVEAQMDQVKLRGETGGFDGVDKLVGELETVKCFRDVKRNKVQKSRDGSKIIFELSVRVDCAGGTSPQGAKGR